MSAITQAHYFYDTISLFLKEWNPLPKMNHSGLYYGFKLVSSAFVISILDFKESSLIKQ